MTLDSLKDFKEYKKAKVLLKDLSIMNKILNLSIQALSPYVKYKLIMEITSLMKNNKSLLEIHIKKCNEVINNRENKK